MMQIKIKGKRDANVRIKPYREIGPALVPRRVRTGLPKVELTVRYEGFRYTIVSQDKEEAYWWLHRRVTNNGAR